MKKTYFFRGQVKLLNTDNLTAKNKLGLHAQFHLNGPWWHRGSWFHNSIAICSKNSNLQKWLCPKQKQFWASQIFLKKTRCLVCFGNDLLLKTNLSEECGTLGFFQVACFFLKAVLSPLLSGPLIQSWKWAPSAMFSESLYADHQFGWESLPTGLKHHKCTSILNLQIFSNLKTLGSLWTILPRCNFLFYIPHSWVIGYDSNFPWPWKKCQATSCSDLKSLWEDLVHPARCVRRTHVLPSENNKPTALHHETMSHTSVLCVFTPEKWLIMQMVHEQTK